MPQPTIPDALWRLPASQTAALVRAHQVSATEVARAALARVDAVNPRLNAIVECRPDEVLARAAAIDAALARGEDPGPLAGVPITTKVNVDQAGYATTNGIKAQRDHIAKEDDVLYLIADEKIAVPVQAAMVEAFEKIEEERIGVGTHERYHEMLKEFRRGYLSPK